MSDPFRLNGRRLAGLVCVAALGLATAGGVSACGEKRGGVDVQGSGTTSTTSTAPTGTTPETSTAP